MLSITERAKIRTDLETIAEDLGLTVLKERARIENISDFPLVQITFQTEGRRQLYWRDQLHEYQDPLTHEWQTWYGNISQATVSVSIRSLDVDELQLLANQFATELWHKATSNWTIETNQVEFRGTDPPKFLPAYLDSVEQRINIYTCVIDFFVDYEFVWPILDPPITNFVFDNSAGLVDGGMKSITEDPMIIIAPGCYVMSAKLVGGSSTYSMSTKLVGGSSTYSMMCIIE